MCAEYFKFFPIHSLFTFQIFLKTNIFNYIKNLIQFIFEINFLY